MLFGILQVLIGGLITLAVAVFVEYVRAPNLRIRITRPTDQRYEPGRPAHTARFLHLELTNLPLARWLSWLYRIPAVQCVGTLTFHRMDGSRIFVKAMPVRWNRLPEPVPIPIKVGDTTNWYISPAVMTTTPRVDLHPGDTEPFDVAARFDDEPDCYGWSNENYFTDPVWRAPQWKLPSGRYLVKVTVASGGRKCVHAFRLNNDVSQQDFRLEPATRGDDLKIRD